jgi:phosphoenolpyruvate-protein phosphotransferase
MQHHTLKAPLSGCLLPLENVPDPVFAKRMLGDGIALDPSSNALLAPCDALVAHLHDACHAITLRTESGLHVLLHIGIDTVQLKGEGFLPHVAAGQSVKAGDTLIEFDPTYIRAHARSLLTIIVITDAESVSEMKAAKGEVRAGRDVILQLRSAAADTRAVTDAPARCVSDMIAIRDPDGLHARPAARLASTARQYEARLTLRKGDREANAKSLVSLMQLDVRQGDQVQLLASGDGAERAIDAVFSRFKEALREAEQYARATEAGQGEPPGLETKRDKSAAAGVASKQAAHTGVAGDQLHGQTLDVQSDPAVLTGTTASPGLAMGAAFRLRRQHFDWPESTDDPVAAQRKLDHAIEQAKATLQAVHARVRDQAGAAPAAIFAAQQEVLADPDILDMARRSIREGKSAASAWHASISHHAGRLAELENELLAARASDLRDVGERVLNHLVGQSEQKIDVPDGAILIAEELTPSQASILDRGQVRGFCTTMGTPSSHVAIVARSLGVPAIVGMDARVLAVADGTPVIVDADRGTLRIDPSVQEIAHCKDRIEASRVELAEVSASAAEPAETRDGHRVRVLANLSHPRDVEQLRACGADGVGLLRSEFLFVDRSSAPDEQEQRRVYEDVARKIRAGEPLVIRTLDVGGDKPLPYLPIPQEENPFLGERGIRVGLNRPYILRTQIRAILAAARSASADRPSIKVMFPMIATIEEWRQAKAIFDDEQTKLAAEVSATSAGEPALPAISVGMMVEVPAAAILAEQFAREVDFFSIGTNDLTQYTLAMDRGNPAFSTQLDGLSPSVVHLVAKTVAGAHKYNKPVSVCGNIASDPRAVPILMGLGVTELSVDIGSIPRLKHEIRSMTFAQCKEMAGEALQAGTSAEVHTLAMQRGK